jgi:hypothetical protein
MCVTRNSLGKVLPDVVGQPLEPPSELHAVIIGAEVVPKCGLDYNPSVSGFL